MKKILFVLLPIILIGGCEKDFNSLVDSKSSPYQVTSASSSQDSVYYTLDSVITISLKLNSSENVSGVYCDIYSSDSKKLNSSAIKLYDDGDAANHGDTTLNDNQYSIKFNLKQSYPIGNYRIDYFVTDINESIQKVAVSQFYYHNGQTNAAPIISNLVAPDTVVAVDPKAVIFLSIKVKDGNGLNDIKTVSFLSHKPDGNVSGPIQMYDDGGSVSGDQVAGDGIYSVLIEVTPDNQKGTYRFEFQAQDRSDALSNIINHNVVVK